MGPQPDRLKLHHPSRAAVRKDIDMRIGDICSRGVVTCDAGASVPQLARLMREEHVGDVIVVEETAGERRPVGIVTDRDLVVQVLAAGIDADGVSAGDLMHGVSTVLETEAIYDAIWTMRRSGARRLPVVDGRNALFGIVTMDDLMQFLAEELTELSRVSPQQRRTETELRSEPVR
jgi:CBS domain-containing protein